MSANVTITKNAALTACATYANSRERFQTTALRYVFEQSLNGNADAAMLVLTSSGMLLPSGNVSADGKAAIRWLLASPADGGCGLSGIIKWDDDSARVSMCKGWTKAADKLDRTAAEHNLSAVLWYTWAKSTVPASKAFDLEAKIVALVKKAAKDAGMSPAEIEAHVHKACAAGLLALKVA